jgi:hypothetical protein
MHSRETARPEHRLKTEMMPVNFDWSAGPLPHGRVIEVLAQKQVAARVSADQPHVAATLVIPSGSISILPDRMNSKKPIPQHRSTCWMDSSVAYSRCPSGVLLNMPLRTRVNARTACSPEAFDVAILVDQLADLTAGTGGITLVRLFRSGLASGHVLPWPF